MQSLAPIPLEMPIVEKSGAISLFFRERWQQLINSFALVPTVADTGTISGLTALLATTTLQTTTIGGVYEVGYYIRKTVADGVSSSLTVTIGWTENGTALTRVFAALTTDSNVANQSDVVPIVADASTNITIAIAYASNTPATMTYRYRAVVKLCA